MSAVDSGSDDGEAYGDYTHDLGKVVPALERAGIRVIVWNDAVLAWQDSLGRHVVNAADEDCASIARASS